MKRVVASSALLLVLAVIGGAVWVWATDPADWVVTDRGTFPSDAASRGQFAAIVVFIGIGAVLCLVWGWVIGHVQRDLGWLLVPPFVVVASLAALITWRVGIWLGPSDPRDAVGTSIGDRLPAPLAIDAVAPFLVWPMMALVGLLVAAWLDRSDEEAS